MSAPAIQFKGEGWYVTDYSRKGSKPEKETGGETGASADKPKAKDNSTKKTGADTT